MIIASDDDLLPTSTMLIEYGIWGNIRGYIFTVNLTFTNWMTCGSSCSLSRYIIIASADREFNCIVSKIGAYYLSQYKIYIIIFSRTLYE